MKCTVTGESGRETIGCCSAWLFWNALHLFRLVGFRKQLQVFADWTLARIFPRDSAIMRVPTRCPICRRTAAAEEHRAA